MTKGMAFFYNNPGLYYDGTSCSAGAQYLGGLCVDGVCCDTACGQGLGTDRQACSANLGAGKCACPTGKTDCSGTCANLQTDTKNCGTCGGACSSQAYCITGGCVNGAYLSGTVYGLPSGGGPSAQEKCVAVKCEDNRPPSGQTCTVTNGTGTVAAANITNVAVTCK